MDTLFLSEHRCKCGKLLLKGILFDGTLEVKCRRCGEINRIGRIKLADNAKRYLLVIDNNGFVVNVSDSACRILGYSADELIGKSFTQINPTLPNEVGKKLFGLESALNEENYFKLDTVHQSRDGRKFPVSALLKLYRPTKDERCVLVSVELNDQIGEKIPARGNVVEFLDNACDFYFEVDKDGMGEHISPSMERLFGLSQEIVIGKDYLEVVPEEMRAEAKKTFEHFSATEQPYRMVCNVGTGTTGEATYSELYFTPKFDDSRRFCGYRVLGWIVKNSKVDEGKADQSNDREYGRVE